MLRILPLADDLILPQARQEIYFFNRIGQKQSFERVYKMHEDSVGTDKPFWELVESHPNHAAFFLQPNINQRPHHLARLLSFPDEFAI